VIPKTWGINKQIIKGQHSSNALLTSLMNPSLQFAMVFFVKESHQKDLWPYSREFSRQR
jgi:hypothetical protein